MSLPLTRRIAKAALMTAAGAASVVGAAGSASAVDLQQPSGLGGLSNLDTAGVDGTVEDAAHGVTTLAGQAGDETLTQAGQALGPTARMAMDTSTAANELVGGAAGEVARGLPTQGLPTHGISTQNLPTNGISGGLSSPGLLA